MPSYFRIGADVFGLILPKQRYDLEQLRYHLSLPFTAGNIF